MAELRVKETGTIKLYESDNTSSVTIASPASLGADRTVTLPDASVTLASGTMLATDGSGASLTALNASELGSGTVPTARLGSGTASSSTVLYGDQTYKAEPGGANTPAFEAYLNSDQTLSDSTLTTVACNIEKFDSDGCYDNTTYRFTPTTAGKYYCYGTADIANDDDTQLKNLRIYLIRNGSGIEYTEFVFTANYIKEATISVFSVVDFNGSSDYLEVKVDVAVNDNVNNLRLEGDGDFGLTKFGAFKLIGVS